MTRLQSIPNMDEERGCIRPNCFQSPCTQSHDSKSISSSDDDDDDEVIFHSADIKVEASAPQMIRLLGFHAVFDRYSNNLDDAVCNFGPHNMVDCLCNPMTGTLECDVPRSSRGDDLIVRARIAEFETPPLKIRYGIESSDQQHVLHAEDEHAENLTDPFDDNWHLKMLKLISSEKRKEPYKYRLLHQCIAECIGTMFIVIFGVGSVCSAVLFGTTEGLWQIATVWGFGVALAIYMTASVSGAHLNPAVSLASAIFRPNEFPFRKLLPYWFAQYLGGILGGAFNLMIYGPAFSHFEKEKNIIRGSIESLETAKAFGEYFPAPGSKAPDISPAFAMFVEAWGTGILMFVILALTDQKQKIFRQKEMIPFFIGFTVAVLISLYAPLTQAGWNPARDFGPRLVAAMAGWGRIAIPGPKNGFWIYIIGPKIGASIAALLYDILIKPGLID